MCKEATISWGCCGDNWTPHEGFKPPIISVCPQADLTTVREDENELKLMPCAPLTHELPPLDQDGFDALRFPGACDKCLVNRSAAKSKLEAITKETREKYEACKTVVYGRWDKSRVRGPQQKWMKGKDYLLCDIRSRQTHMWYWALLQLDVSIAESKQLGRDTALKYFIEQCELLEELAKREARYDRNGWFRAN